MMHTRPFETIAIVGAGFMGAQIGLHLAVHGYRVTLIDTSDDALVRAAASQAEELERRRAEGRITAAERADIPERIELTTSLAEGVRHAELVIEAAPERLEIKRALFAELDRLCPPSTILATNSSSIRISAIEDATTRRDRVLNLHFYGVVWQRPMVDLMRGTATSDETIARVSALARSAGLTPILVQRESTGFVFNRVWRAVKKECLKVVDQGVASHEDVDRAWMIFTGAREGPFAIMDMVGLDVVRDIELVYYHESGDASDAPPALLLDKIAKGELGIKTGQGFYTYPNPAYADPDWLRGAPDEEETPSEEGV
jgi:3-hydroxybutyryl-CoA dehydrogenase